MGFNSAFKGLKNIRLMNTLQSHLPDMQHQLLTSKRINIGFRR